MIRSTSGEGSEGRLWCSDPAGWGLPVVDRSTGLLPVPKGDPYGFSELKAPQSDSNWQDLVGNRKGSLVHSKFTLAVSACKTGVPWFLDVFASYGSVFEGESAEPVRKKAYN